MQGKINYQSYVNQYNKRAAKHTMHDTHMLSQLEYETTYRALAKELREEGKSTGHIAEQIAAKQEYAISRLQAKKLKEVVDSQGITGYKSLKSIRENSKEIFDEIKDNYKDLTDEERDTLAQAGINSFRDYVSYLYGSK